MCFSWFASTLQIPLKLHIPACTGAASKILCQLRLASLVPFATSLDKLIISFAPKPEVKLKVNS